MSRKERTFIVGIGSDFGDDQLGLIVAQQLAFRLSGYKVRGLRSPVDLCDYVGDIEELHIVDACHGMGPPGTAFRQDWHSTDYKEDHFAGTHDFGLVATLKLMQGLGTLPPRVTIWSIEACEVEQSAQQSMGAELSPIVAGTAEKLMTRILAEVTGSAALEGEPINHA